MDNYFEDHQDDIVSRERRPRRNPPIHIAEEEIHRIIDALENINTPYIDGRVIGAMCRMAIFTGLIREKLLLMKIGDIPMEGGLPIALRIDDSTMHLCEDAREYLLSYLKYLKKNGYATTKKSPLFPAKKGGFYSERNFRMHCRKCFYVIHEHIDFRKFAKAAKVYIVSDQADQHT